MHFHRKSSSLGSMKVLFVLLIAFTASVSCALDLTPEEIIAAVNEIAPKRYCGKYLNDAMKIFCTPMMRTMIVNKTPSKKSLDSRTELDFDSFDLDRIAAENDDYDMSRSRYNTDDSYFSNDLPFWFSSQGKHRRRRGIIEECCKRACFKYELIHYCPPRS